MTIIAATISVAYTAIGVFGRRWGLSADRARTFRTAGYLACGWTAVCAAHFLLRH